jgi:hypothetical protein
MELSVLTKMGRSILFGRFFHKLVRSHCLPIQDIRRDKGHIKADNRLDLSMYMHVGLIDLFAIITHLFVH